MFGWAFVVMVGSAPPDIIVGKHAKILAYQSQSSLGKPPNIWVVTTEVEGGQAGGQATMATHPKNTKEKKRKEKKDSLTCMPQIPCLMWAETWRK